MTARSERGRATARVSPAHRPETAAVPAGQLPRAAVLAAALAAAVLAAAPGCSNSPAPADPVASAAGRPAPAGEPAAPAGQPAAEPAGEVAESPAPADGRGGPPAAGTDSAAEAAGPVDDDPTVVTIEPAGGRAPEPRTLAEAAQAARERRGDRPRASTVITNENLAEWAARGQVTLAPEPAGDPAAAAPAGGDAAGGGAGTAAAPSRQGEPGVDPAGGDPGAPPAGPRDEAYWRDRARDLRTRWATATEEIERLDKEAADLRWAFYAEDDPYYRDERIKPSWDRALDELRRARQDERYFREQVEELMEEGRRAGALPGWLREGVELEPEETAEPDAPIGREPRSTEPIEPPTAGPERPR